MLKQEICEMHNQRMDRVEKKLDDFIKDIGDKVGVISTAMTANSSNFTNFFKWSKVLRWIVGGISMILAGFLAWGAVNIIENMKDIATLEAEQSQQMDEAMYKKYILHKD